MSSDIDNSVNKIKNILSEVEDILENHDFKTCFQVPLLLSEVAKRLSMPEKDMKSNDAIIRWHLHNSSLWEIKRGMHGGVKRKEDVKASQDEKDKLKKELSSQIDEMINSI